MGNDDTCKLVGIGEVCLLTSTGCRMVLKDVSHVPNIRLNLILTGQLIDEGYSVTFINDIWKFCKGNLVLPSETASGNNEGYCGPCPKAKYYVRDACTLALERGQCASRHNW